MSRGRGTAASIVIRRRRHLRVATLGRAASLRRLILLCDPGGVMKLPRRTFLHLAAGAAALPTIARMAWAQAYPARSVRLIVGFPAGNASDIFARLIGQWLSERLGQSFVVQNRPGAGRNGG